MTRFLIYLPAVILLITLIASVLHSWQIHDVIAYRESSFILVQVVTLILGAVSLLIVLLALLITLLWRRWQLARRLAISAGITIMLLIASIIVDSSTLFYAS